MLDLKQKASKSLLGSDEGMIPMINIIFLLLIFFMIAGQIESQSEPLALPESSSETEQDNAEISISINEEGELKLNGESVRGELLNALKSLSLNETTVVNCRVHRTLPASALDPILKAAKALKTARLQIATESGQ